MRALLILVALGLLSVPLRAAIGEGPVSFERDLLPRLSDRPDLLLVLTSLEVCDAGRRFHDGVGGSDDFIDEFSFDAKPRGRDGDYSLSLKVSIMSLIVDAKGGVTGPMVSITVAEKKDEAKAAGGHGENENKQPNQALQTTPMTRSVCEKTTEFGHPQRGV